MADLDLNKLRETLDDAAEALGTALDEMRDYADTHPAWSEIWNARRACVDHAPTYLFRIASRALSDAAKLEAAEGMARPSYSYAVGVAGDQYIRSVAFQGQHELPAKFRWSELFDALLSAAYHSADAPSPDAGDGWMPIETAPNNVSILVCHDDDSVDLIEEDENDYNWSPYDDPVSYGTRPTHWRPLPAPPRAAKGEAE